MMPRIIAWWFVAYGLLAAVAGGILFISGLVQSRGPSRGPMGGAMGGMLALFGFLLLLSAAPHFIAGLGYLRTWRGFGNVSAVLCFLDVAAFAGSAAWCAHHVSNDHGISVGVFAVLAVLHLVAGVVFVRA